MASKTVQEIVVERIITKIKETGELPWQKPYRAPSMNWMREHEYKGINKFLLEPGEYITKKEITQYNEKHGKRFWFESGTPRDIVVFYSRTEKKISAQQAGEIMKKGGHNRVFPKPDGTWVSLSWILRFYEVYNIKYIRHLNTEELRKQPEYKDGIFKKEQVERNGKKYNRLILEGGSPALKDGITEADFELLPRKLGDSIIETNTDAQEIIDTYCDGSGVQIMHGNDKAAYVDAYDAVITPDKTLYNSGEAYYRTIFHELIHSTGVEKRLNRKCFEDYHQAKTERSKEELVAEVGALLLASEAGFSDESALAENSVNYVAGWCRWMEENPNELVTGFFAAERAKNYVLAGGVDTGSASTTVIGSPNEKGEDAEFSGETDDVESSNTGNNTPPNEDASTKEPEGDNNNNSNQNNEDTGSVTKIVEPVRKIKTIKGVRAYYIEHLSLYFKTDNVEMKKRILGSVTADDLKYIYKKLAKKDLPSNVKNKAKALTLIDEVVREIK